MRSVSRILASLAVLFSVAVLAQPASAQKKKDKTAMEEFDEVDPYTNGDRSTMDALGYVSFGPFAWRDGERTPDVQQNLGGLDMLFVETSYFRIASSLGSYPIPNDREEKAKLEEEFKRLKKKLGRKFRAPKKEIDPWLRLHLYAQRLEEAHAMFMEDFGITASDFPAKRRFLWQPEKHLVLLAERRSEFGRYMRTYMNADNEYSWRWAYPKGGIFVGLNAEVIKQNWDEPEDKPLDAMFHCALVNSLGCIFIDAYADNLYGAPRWLSFAMGHYHTRRTDPRWVTATGRTDQAWREEDHLWEQRVSKLVKNDFFVSTNDMFQWMKYEDLGPRDHMVAWSKLEFLMTKVKCDHKKLLLSLCRRLPYDATDDAKQKELLRRQREAWQEHLGMTPEEFDEKWAAWVKKSYRKR